MNRDDFCYCSSGKKYKNCHGLICYCGSGKKYKDCHGLMYDCNSEGLLTDSLESSINQSSILETRSPNIPEGW